ncbi:hypothetical protein M231_06650 [Tremella mesenterica]|uniref:DUF3835 domain-containing protein n=1 Tax=Tremella mesenterica TaxID=5217 RepID=A0A4Q1BBB6_TREME|nr:hypothetical protein M231_06650 [Tremella mesenterica]
MEQDLATLTPSSPSLSSHLQALDLLSARLTLLQNRTRWVTQIPLNEVAFMRGWTITGNVKVDIGGWWIEMTLEEATEYVERRKRALLQQHLRYLEGPSSTLSTEYPSSFTSSITTAINENMHPSRTLPRTTIYLNPLYSLPHSRDDPSLPSPPSVLLSPASSRRADTSIPVEKASSATTESAVNRLVSSVAGNEKAPSPAVLIPSPLASSSESAKSPKTNVKPIIPPPTENPARSVGTGESNKPTPTIKITPVETVKNDGSGLRNLLQALGRFTEPLFPLDSVDIPTSDTPQLPSQSQSQIRSKSEVMSNVDPTMTEEGLPITEIREDFEGNLLVPIPSSSVLPTNTFAKAIDTSSSSHSTERIGNDTEGTHEEEGEQTKKYWSDEAKKRREQLFKQVFDDLSDEEPLEDYNPPHSTLRDTDLSTTEVNSTSSSKLASPSMRSGIIPHVDRSHIAPPALSPICEEVPINSSIPSPTTEIRFTPSVPNLQTTSSLTPTSAESSASPSSPIQAERNIPKSILKPPFRKKSVSFDPSLPSPPDSPEVTRVKTKYGFPLPSEYDFEKEIPILPEPQPRSRGPIAVSTIPTVSTAYQLSDLSSQSSSQVGAPTAAPHPRSNVKDEGMFSAFKRGFLSKPPSTSTKVNGPKTTKTKIDLVPKSHLANPAQSGGGMEKPELENGEENEEEEGQRNLKPSLFARRLAESTVVERAPLLPPMSKSAGGSLKAGVVEHPPEIRSMKSQDGKGGSSKRGVLGGVHTPTVRLAGYQKAGGPFETKQEDTIGVPIVKASRPAAVAGHNDSPIAVHSQDLRQNGKPNDHDDTHKPRAKGLNDFGDNQNVTGEDENSSEEDEEDSDDGFFDDDDDEEDEYDLDDALLAREVALEYHQKQAYSTFNRNSESDDTFSDPQYSGHIGLDYPGPSTSHAQRGNVLGENDVGGNGEEGKGVFIGIPSLDISGQPIKTDYSKLIRVGKLENGNLVLAPGEEWSDSDPDLEGLGEEEKEKRMRKREVKRKLGMRSELHFEDVKSSSKLSEEFVAQDEGSNESSDVSERKNGLGELLKVSPGKNRLRELSKVSPGDKGVGDLTKTGTIGIVRETMGKKDVQGSQISNGIKGKVGGKAGDGKKIEMEGKEKKMSRFRQRLG